MIIGMTEGQFSQVAKKRFRSVGGTPKSLTKEEGKILVELYALERDSVEMENRLHVNWEGMNEVPSAKEEVEAGFPCENKELKVSPLGWLDLLERAEKLFRIWRKQLADFPLDDQSNEALVSYRKIVERDIGEFEKWFRPVLEKSRTAFDARTAT